MAEKLKTQRLLGSFCSTTDVLSAPSCTTTPNEQSGLGEETPGASQARDDSQLCVEVCVLEA
ncbi:hypothetical protein NQZ68_005869 [Dissostichus eleginoides]|nr:hypothetical protein NQZ68_005869 [Dissostichus eleginoides]